MEGRFIESRKRIRDDSNDSSFNSVGSKIGRVDSVDLDFNSSIDFVQIGNNHADDPPVQESFHFQAHAIQEDLLKILDEEADASIDHRDSAIQDLDSVIRSFEKEIRVPAPVQPPGIEVELGYLLEASDDDLGLPPAAGPSEEDQEIEAVDFGAQLSLSGMKGFLGFEDEVASYWWLDRLISENEWNQGEEEVVALGGLFDHTDATSTPEMPYRSETMSCL